ncbi:MAG: eriC [Ilumatobacteraceae bacterium]|nr:eriC [Ilumatobacteraceae bacterium]
MPDGVDAAVSFGGRIRTWTVRVLLATVVGLAAGVSAAVFLHAMDWATEAFATHRLLLFGLPVGGLAVGLVYHHVGGASAAGNNLILDEIHEPQAWIPRRMAVLVMVATVVTHLFGGSAGREGTGVQMAGSLADALARRLRITGLERRLMLVAAIGAGFAGVFGVPVAGVAFALEVQRIGRVRRLALVPAAIACAIADRTVLALGVTHTALPDLGRIDLGPALLAKVVAAGVAFGLMSLVFAEALHRTKALTNRLVAWPPLRPFLGGLLVIAATGLVGSRAYLGLSLPLIGLSVAGGAGVALGAFALKTVFTALTLGTGFYGGEVTPLFVVGATLGVTMAHVLDAPVALLAAVGLAAVFAGASNTPVASTLLGLELFGWHPTLGVVFALACGVSYVCSGSSTIYPSQQRRRWGFRHQAPAPA